MEAELHAYGRRLGLSQRTPWAPGTQKGCSWEETLTFPTRVCPSALSKSSEHPLSALPSLSGSFNGFVCTHRLLLASKNLVCVQWRDLPADAHLALTVWEVTVGKCGRHAKAGATCRLFSRKGRLKGARQTLQLHPDRAADPGWTTQTPAKLPLAQRGELG